MLEGRFNDNNIANIDDHSLGYGGRRGLYSIAMSWMCYCNGLHKLIGVYDCVGVIIINTVLAVFSVWKMHIKNVVLYIYM